LLLILDIQFQFMIYAYCMRFR